MLSSASSVVSYQKFQTSYYYLIHQLLFGVLPGLTLFFIASKIYYHKWQKLSLYFLVATILLLIAVFIPGIGAGYGKAKSWILFPGLSLQPAEIAKLTFILYLSSLLEKRGRKITDVHFGLLPFLFLTGIISVLIVLQPDFGTLSVIVLTSLVIYFVAGGKFLHLSLIGLGGLGLLVLLIKSAPYRAERLAVFLNPGIDPQGIGYHINQALIAVGSGGLFGVGLGNSRQKFAYLPEVFSDSIFAVIAEEMGFLICAALVILFLILLYRGFKIAKNSPDTFGKLVACGITFWFVFQAMINIMSMIGLMPMTGLPLPFISYGGSAMTVSLFAVGVLVNISKQTR